MKKIMITTIAGTLLSAAILTSCNSPAKKVENAQENVTEAKEDLAEANKEVVPMSRRLRVFRIERAPGASWLGAKVSPAGEQE